MVTAFLPALLAVSFAPGACEVVVPPRAPECVHFAAKEATNFLSRALGAPVPLSSSPTPGLVHLVLGGSEKETEGFERDEYVVESHGDTVRVYGRDSYVPFEKNVLKTMMLYAPTIPGSSSTKNESRRWNIVVFTM